MNDTPQFSGQESPPSTYDYRLYDQIWQRVSPGSNPYPDIRAADTGGDAAESAPDNLGNLPGAETNPCCLGSAAQEDLPVIQGFLEEELRQRRCYLAVAGRVQNRQIVRLLRSIAQGKENAARAMAAAYFLTTGTCYTPLFTAQQFRWHCVADALRAIYHQEACNSFNYLRAADGTTDPCLAKLYQELGQQAAAYAESILKLLGTLLPC